MTAKKSAKKFGEALELLEEVAKGKKTDLQKMVSEKYGSLKSVLGDVAQGLQKQGRDLASRSDKSVRQNPWPYLGGTAIGFLILGFFLSRRKST